MTDPQNDVKCRDCGQPTQAKTERCAGCSTPAGRLVTALAALGVKAKADSRCDVSVDILAITVDEEEWTISSVEATHAETVDAAANAIAAIVQAPGLRLNIPREQYAEDVLQAFSDGCDFGGAAMNQWFGHAFDVGDGSGPDFDAAAMWRDRVAKRVAGSSTTTARAETAERDLCLVTTERDTLAARVAALEAHNGRMVALITEIADACDDAGQEEFWGGAASLVVDALPGREWPDAADNLRRLAAGEVDDG